GSGASAHGRALPWRAYEFGWFAGLLSALRWARYRDGLVFLTIRHSWCMLKGECARGLRKKQDDLPHGDGICPRRVHFAERTRWSWAGSRRRSSQVRGSGIEETTTATGERTSWCNPGQFS